MFTGDEAWTQYADYKLVSMEIGGRKRKVYPNLPNDLYSALYFSKNQFPKKAAILEDTGESVSYQSMWEKVNSLAFYLSKEKRVTCGSKIAVMLMTGINFGITFLALNKLGALCIPLPTKYRKSEIYALLNKFDFDGVITEEQYLSWFTAYPRQPEFIITSDEIHRLSNLKFDIPEESPDCSPDISVMSRPSLLVFTSGTTSQSKGVLIRNYNIMHAVRSYQLTLDIHNEDNLILPIPMYLITGLVAIFGLNIFTGATLYTLKLFDADKVLDCVKTHHITFLHASPTVFSMLLGERSAYPNLPSLRKMACGSSNMPLEKIRQLHDWLPNCEFHTVYGLTETTSPGTILPCAAYGCSHPGSSGIPIPGMSVKVISDTGAEASPGERGEIWLTGTNVIESYYPENKELIQDGWLDTGDIGYCDKDGYLYICDRKKDMINRGGEKITSFDVENELYKLPGIQDAAVVGIPDSLYGEVPVAAVTALQGYTLHTNEIIAALRKNLASYQVPVKIMVLNHLPLTANGKVDKKSIRTLFSQFNTDKEITK